MGLFDRLRGELIDIVEWIDDSQHTLVWRFPRYNNEIKNGAQLIVRPGQMAVLVSGGEIADSYPPGHYELETQNMPILSTLKGWKYGFESPFKAEVYFVSTRQITDLKWGTPNPIMLRDPEFGPIRIRAFGTYALKAVDPKALLTEIVGTDGDFQSDEITNLLRAMITSAFSEAVAELQIAALDLATKYEEIADTVRKKLIEQIDDEYGLDCTQLHVVNISLPETVEKALDTRTSMGVIGDMNRYQQYQMGNAMTAAAENPGGGGASEGLGLGLGLAMAGRMMPGGFTGNAPAGAAAGQPGGAQAGGGQAGGAAPPPPPPAWHVAVGGQTKGPFALNQIASGVASGEVTRDTMVWTAGMDGWQAAGTVAALAGLFAAQTPPPPPPPAG
jgi:membrane protease subunit (stomatin/prohibitin family)